MKRITTHPGEMLHEEFMVPLGLSALELQGRSATRSRMNIQSCGVRDVEGIEH